MSTSRLAADLHLHSRYSQATSRSLDLAELAAGARDRGIDLLAAPDYTHPEWRAELQAELTEVSEGLFEAHGRLFALVAELSCVWRQGGRGRRVHFLVMAPGMAAVEALSAELAKTHRLESDGRPMLNMPARQLVETLRGIDERFELIPAHVWTPWYGIFGSKSGFDSMEECFGDYADCIHAVETGLSSDPAMNWSFPDTASRTIVSFSDAHSVGSMGRELTVFDAEPDYASVLSAIREGRVVETVEFHPEHGKYHFDGHRKCGVRFTPEESQRAGGRCPVCGRLLTLGVLNRISALSGGLLERPEPDEDGLLRGPEEHAPFRSLVPLRELLGFALGVGPKTKTVERVYRYLVSQFDGELNVLTGTPPEELARAAGEKLAASVLAVRQGRVEVSPGYDGVYGTVEPAL